MIDIHTEQLLTLKSAARSIPGRDGDRPINISTIWRWVLARKLESIRIGGIRYTSRQAIQRFVERLNPEQTTAPAIRTATQRRRASEKAARELEAAGI